MMEKLLAHTSVLLVPVVDHHFMTTLHLLVMTLSNSVMYVVPKLKCPQSLVYEDDLVFSGQMTSTVTRSQCKREPLGCDTRRDWWDVPFLNTYTK